MSTVISQTAQWCQNTTSRDPLPCCAIASVQRGLLGIVGKEAERAVSVLVYVLLKRKQCKKGPMYCVRDHVWIYSGFIATYYFHGSTSVNGVSVPP